MPATNKISSWLRISAKTVKSCPLWFRVGPSLALVLCCLLSPQAHGQLTILSKGNQQSKWRETQLALLNEQLADPQFTGDMKLELAAQVKWLSAWQPGKLSQEPLWASEKKFDILAEPAIDPEERVGELRERLLGKGAMPTAKDTRELQGLLAKFPDDVGVRQLHLHWLDQLQYRKTYPVEISEAAFKLTGLLDALPDSNETELAFLFSLYRQGRALAYRELPDVLEKLPLADPAQNQLDLVGIHRQIKSIVKEDRPEFILLDIRMLRSDQWNGRALALLENMGSQLNQRWFLKKRRELLADLHWTGPAKEADAIYAGLFPDDHDPTSP